MRKLLFNYGLYGAWLSASISILGSFFWSERLHFEPCSLCWLQRLFTAPLAIILGIATYRQDRGVVIYALPLAAAGGLIALYHLLIQKFDLPFIAKLCSGSAECTKEAIAYFGFITPPMLSLSAFLLIALFLLAARTQATQRVVVR